MGQIIQIKNWDTYQHYHKNKSARNERFSMVWFKMYADSLQDSSFMELNSNLKWIFIGLMCLACKTNNNISYNPKWLQRTLNVRGIESSLKHLVSIKLIEVVYNDSIPIREDKIREDKIREDKIRSKVAPALPEKKNITELKGKELEETVKINRVFEHWNTKKIIIHRELDKKTMGAINSIRKLYRDEEIAKAIDNFAIIALDKTGKYWWTHDNWTLAEFLKRGFEKFKEESKPMVKMLQPDKQRNIAKEHEVDDREAQEIVKREMEADNRRAQALQYKRDKENFESIPELNRKEYIEQARAELIKEGNKFINDFVLTDRAIKISKKAGAI